MNAIKYLLDIGFDDAHLPDLFNDDDKSYYTIPELMEAYHVAEQCQECKELYQAEEIWQAENPKQNKSNE